MRLWSSPFTAIMMGMMVMPAIKMGISRVSTRKLFFRTLVRNSRLMISHILFILCSFLNLSNKYFVNGGQHFLEVGYRYIVADEVPENIIGRAVFTQFHRIAMVFLLHDRKMVSGYLREIGYYPQSYTQQVLFESLLDLPHFTVQQF